MAKFFAGIETTQTGLLELPFTLSEERAQDIFAMLLETAAPITRVRTVRETVTVPDPTEDEPDRTKLVEQDRGEFYQDARKLGECLRDEITIFITGLEARAIAHKRAKAARAAADAVAGETEITPAG